MDRSSFKTRSTTALTFELSDEGGIELQRGAKHAMAQAMDGAQ